MSTWTINGQPAASIGASGLRRSLMTQGEDGFSFVLDRNVDAASLYRYGSTVIVKRDQTTFFTGRVIRTAPFSDDQTERHVVSLAGPWWYLENLVYQQTWNYFTTTIEKTRVVLGQSVTGAIQTTGQVITEILTYAIAAGAPFQIGQIATGPTIPLDEAVDITCAEAIRRLLRWTPDVSVWFDYSTEPTPTIHIRPRAQLTECSIPLLSASELSIAPRYDLQVPAVVIRYELAGANGSPSITSDVCPLGVDAKQFGAMVITAELAGWAVQTPHIEEIEVDALPTDLSDDNPAMIAWWKSIYKALGGAGNLTINSIRSCTRTGVANYPNRLVNGRLHSWLKAKFSVHDEADVIRCLATYVIKDENDVVVQEHTDAPIQFAFTATDATSKTYDGTTTLGGLEPAPTGLAAALYASAGSLLYDGSLVLGGFEVPGTITPGCVLNITGGNADWSAMRTPIVSVDEDIDGGYTTVRFGPARHLGYDDLVQLLRANRVRKPSRECFRRTSIEAAGNKVETSGKGPNPQPTSGPGRITLRFHD